MVSELTALLSLRVVIDTLFMSEEDQVAYPDRVLVAASVVLDMNTTAADEILASHGYKTLSQRAVGSAPEQSATALRDAWQSFLRQPLARSEVCLSTDNRPPACLPWARVTPLASEATAPGQAAGNSVYSRLLEGPHTVSAWLRRPGQVQAICSDSVAFFVMM